MTSTTQTRKWPCANNSDTDKCPQEGRKACAGCRLVMYCSSSCQKTHWAEHKKACKSPLMSSSWKPSWQKERRTPVFLTQDERNSPPFSDLKNVIGNMPAIDILALARNEGMKYTKNINLLFAASGDLRNVITTINPLPKTFDQKLMVTLNDKDLQVVARNVILLVLILAVEDADTAVDCALHIWYSAQITEAHVKVLNDVVRPLLEDVCTKVANKPAGKMLGKTWTWNNKSIRLVLTKDSWEATLAYLDLPAGLTEEKAYELRVAIMLASERKDYVDRYLHGLSPSHRVCHTKFRQDGIVLPFGNPRTAHNISNPTMFTNPTQWPLADCADPLDGWNASIIHGTSVGNLINDVYGKLYFHVKDVLSAFRRQMETLRVSFALFQLDAVLLKDHLPLGTFARIEISNLADRAYLSVYGMIHCFVPLLQNVEVNPHATVVTLFMHVVHETFLSSGDQHKDDIGRHEASLVSKFWPPRPHKDNNDPYLLLRHFARCFVRDVDKYLDIFLNDDTPPSLMNTARGFLKLQNTIVEKWPCRPKLKPEQPGALEEFEMLAASKQNGAACYLEWQRMRGGARLDEQLANMTDFETNLMQEEFKKLTTDKAYLRKFQKMMDGQYKSM